jgi:hypothetical protein
MRILKLRDTTLEIPRDAMLIYVKPTERHAL